MQQNRSVMQQRARYATKNSWSFLQHTWSFMQQTFTLHVMQHLWVVFATTLFSLSWTDYDHTYIINCNYSIPIYFRSIAKEASFNLSISVQEGTHYEEESSRIQRTPGTCVPSFSSNRLSGSFYVLSV